jgi:pimeloyl-ACP methyl ester carboxylesterase
MGKQLGKMLAASKDKEDRSRKTYIGGNKSLSTYVLIHGSFIGGWCWNKMKTILENEGHLVYAPDLPGHSKNNKTSAKEITLNRYVSFISNFINDINSKVILVGHSLGGVIITKAVEHIFNKVERIVYVCALVPKNGDTAGGLLGSESATETGGFYSIDNTNMHIEVDFRKIDNALFNGCAKDDIAYAKNLIVRQPLIPFTESIIINDENYKKWTELVLFAL